MVGAGAIGAPNKLPNFLVNSKAVNCLLIDDQKKMFTSKDCMFRALLASQNRGQLPKNCRGKLIEMRREYAARWNIPFYQFDGTVPISQIWQFETTFEVRVVLYKSTQAEDGMILGTLFRPSPFKAMKNGALHLDYTNGHCSLVTSIQRYCRSWKCDICNEYMATRMNNLQKHRINCTGEFEPRALPPKVLRFQCTQSIFEQLEKYGIVVTESQRYARDFSCWDLESFPVAIDENDPPNTRCLTYLNKQVVFAASVKSTVPPFTEPVCLRTTTYDPRGLVEQLIDYFIEVSKVAGDVEMFRLQSIFDQIDASVEEHMRQSEDAKTEDVAEYFSITAKELTRLRDRLEESCRCHTFFAFNSARFDIKLILEQLIEVLFEKGIKIDKVIVQHGDYTLIKTPLFVLRDYCRMTAPNLSLDKFMESSGYPGAKMAFPWRVLKNLKSVGAYTYVCIAHSETPTMFQLDSTTFPDRESFTSDLSNTELSQEDYERMKHIFETQCFDLGDYLELYAKW